MTRAIEGGSVEALRAPWRGRGRRRALLAGLAVLVVAVGAGVVAVRPAGDDGASAGPGPLAASGPRLTLDLPPDGAEAGRELLVEGRVEGDAPAYDVGVEVRLAGQGPAPAPRRDAPDDPGSRRLRAERGRPFSVTVTAPAGPCEVVVTARDPAGRADTRLRRVTVLDAPAWFAATPAARRPGLPLARGLRFGERAGEYVNEKDRSVLVWVPPATFRMGSDRPSERPVHDVTITRGFYIGKHEVTWAQHDLLRRVRGEAPRRRRPGVQDEQPVTDIDWGDSAMYCAWAGLRLPTEAEWELAARGTDGRAYPWGDEPPRAHLANFDRDDPYPEAAVIGSFPAGASPCGALDMAGNVFEWTVDRYAEYTTDARVDPTAPRAAHDEIAVVRGGSWNSAAEAVRASARGPGFASNTQGLRVARSESP